MKIFQGTSGQLSRRYQICVSCPSAAPRGSLHPYSERIRIRSRSIRVFPDGTVDVDPLSVVAAVCPNFRRWIRSNCHRCGEDTYYRLGMGEHRTVYPPWMPKSDIQHEYNKSLQGDHEPHVIQRAVLSKLLRFLIPRYRAVTVWIATTNSQCIPRTCMR